MADSKAVKERKSEQIVVRLTARERALIDDLAISHDTTISKTVRYLLILGLDAEYETKTAGK